MQKHPMHNILDGDLPIHEHDNTKFVIALPEGNALRQEFAYEYLDVFVHWNGSLDIRPRFHDPKAAPAYKKDGRDWNYASTRITDLSEIPVETRREIQAVWERYLDTLAKVRDLSLFGDVEEA